MTKKELKQKISEEFAHTKPNGTSSQKIRDLIDEYEPDVDLSEKDKAMECIKALSRIEGYTMATEGLKRTPVLYDNIDYIMKYFHNLLGELER